MNYQLISNSNHLFDVYKTEEYNGSKNHFKSNQNGFMNNSIYANGCTILFSKCSPTQCGQKWKNNGINNMCMRALVQTMFIIIFSGFYPTIVPSSYCHHIYAEKLQYRMKYINSNDYIRTYMS